MDLLFFIVDGDVSDDYRNIIRAYNPEKSIPYVKVFLSSGLPDKYIKYTGDKELSDYEKSYRIGRNLKYISYKMLSKVGCQYLTNYNFDLIYHPMWTTVMIKSVESMPDRNIISTMLYPKTIMDTTNGDNDNSDNISDETKTMVKRDEIINRHCFFRATTDNIELLFNDNMENDEKYEKFLIGTLENQLSYIFNTDSINTDSINNSNNNNRWNIDSYSNDNFVYEYKGYRFFPCVDSDEGDITQIDLSTIGGNNKIDFMINKCNEMNGSCFNTNGWIKNMIKPQDSWMKYDFNFLNGMFVKTVQKQI